MPIARYLARAYPMLPSHALTAALRKKDARINGIRADGKAQVRGGDRVALYVKDQYLTGEAYVLYEGDGFVAVQKEARLPVDADAEGIGEDTLLSRVRARYPLARLVHRLDAGTGGVMVLALTEPAEARLLSAFREHAVQKEYDCVVRGCPDQHEGALTHYLIKDQEDALVRACDAPRPGALTARLRYRVVRQAGAVSRLRVELLTGRTHQIRVQLSKIGHPILGDDKYGDRAFNKAQGQGQIMLWCASMTVEGVKIASQPPWGEKE